jgi:hypothetical protein
MLLGDSYANEVLALSVFEGVADELVSLQTRSI